MDTNQFKIYIMSLIEENKRNTNVFSCTFCVLWVSSCKRIAKYNAIFHHNYGTWCSLIEKKNRPDEKCCNK